MNISACWPIQTETEQLIHQMIFKEINAKDKSIVQTGDALEKIPENSIKMSKEEYLQHISNFNVQYRIYETIIELFNIHRSVYMMIP